MMRNAFTTWEQNFVTSILILRGKVMQLDYWELILWGYQVAESIWINRTSQMHHYCSWFCHKWDFTQEYLSQTKAVNQGWRWRGSSRNFQLPKCCWHAALFGRSLETWSVLQCISSCMLYVWSKPFARDCTQDDWSISCSNSKHGHHCGSQKFNLASHRCISRCRLCWLYGYEEFNGPVCVQSCTGYIIVVANCPVIIYSSLQTETALSTIQAEI